MKEIDDIYGKLRDLLDRWYAGTTGRTEEHQLRELVAEARRRGDAPEDLRHDIALVNEIWMAAEVKMPDAAADRLERALRREMAGGKRLQGRRMGRWAVGAAACAALLAGLAVWRVADGDSRPGVTAGMARVEKSVAAAPRNTAQPTQTVQSVYPAQTGCVDAAEERVAAAENTDVRKGKKRGRKVRPVATESAAGMNPASAHSIEIDDEMRAEAGNCRIVTQEAEAQALVAVIMAEYDCALIESQSTMDNIGTTFMF